MNIYGSDLWFPPADDANSEFIEFKKSHSHVLYERCWDEIHGAFGFCELEKVGPTLSRFIAEKAENGEPFSVLRMNEGEGSVLFGHVFKEYDRGPLDTYVSRKISEIIFGDPKVVADNIEVFRKLLIQAMKTSDVIGAPMRSFIFRRCESETAARVDVRAVCGTYAQIGYLRDFLMRGTSSATARVTSVWLSKNLLPHYEKILGLFPTVVVITGNPGLADLVAKAFGHPRVREILVPTQRAMRLDSSAESIHWPNRYEMVVDEIRQIPEGSLVLVGAGLLGKDYCAKVKNAGSSAIDIGHVADIWSGKKCRPGDTVEFVEKWKLTTGPVTISD
jgi:hypothetical protein